MFYQHMFLITVSLYFVHCMYNIWQTTNCPICTMYLINPFIHTFIQFRYMTGILPIRRKPQNNQSINQYI